MSTLRNKLDRVESDYAHGRLVVHNPLLNPIESLVLDLALAACVQADFENAPPETPFYIELGDDFIGTGAWPSEAIEEARDQIILWTLREQEASR